MSHNHPVPAHGLEPDARRTLPFTSGASPVTYLANTRKRAMADQHGGLDARDFDALDWLRFWLPRSDWHARRVPADRRT